MCSKRCSSRWPNNFPVVTNYMCSFDSSPHVCLSQTRIGPRHAGDVFRGVLSRLARPMRKPGRSLLSVCPASTVRQHQDGRCRAACKTMRADVDNIRDGGFLTSCACAVGAQGSEAHTAPGLNYLYWLFEPRNIFLEQPCPSSSSRICPKASNSIVRR
jgi:hypothetical protein